VSNFGSNNTSAFTLDSTTGVPTVITGSPFSTGTEPVFVALDATGAFAYIGDQSSKGISGETIDATTGALASITGSPFTTSSSPSAIAVSGN
jgi:hypothetical protein